MTTPSQSEASERSGALWRQWVAMIYDGLLIIALFFVAGFALIAIYGAGDAIGEPVIPRTLYQLVMVMLLVMFYGVFWLKGGQTLGMKAWRIRVQTVSGERLSATHVVTRLAAAPLSWLPLGLGYWWSLWDSQHRTWHDHLSGTQVVYVPK